MTTKQQLPEPPPEWPGTVPEYMVFIELLRRGKRHGVDFFYQSNFLGVRTQRGGAVIDFTFADPPDLAINVQGSYWHKGVGIDARDKMVAAQLAGQGITLILMDEDDIYTDVRYYVSEALQYRDHSRVGRGG